MIVDVVIVDVVIVDAVIVDVVIIDVVIVDVVIVFQTTFDINLQTTSKIVSLPQILMLLTVHDQNKVSILTNQH